MPKLAEEKPVVKTPIKTKPVAPSPAAQVIEKRAVAYPELKVNGVPFAPLNITEALAKKIVGWESEKEFQARMIGLHPGTTEDTWKFVDEDKVKSEADLPGGHPSLFLKDEEGNKVRCYNVVNNRPFDDTHCRGLAQSLLTKRWADSRNGKSWSINGESIILSLTGRVDSGQHRLIALILACQMWRKNPKRWALWTEAPSMEGLLVTGVSEEVTQTLDNVKPRSVSDILITSNHFATEKFDGKIVPMSNAGRRACTKMLEMAIDFVWDRTGTGAPYKTQQACLDFLALHPTLEPLVKHLFDENQGNVISRLKLSPGRMAGVAFLMAGSASDELAYRKGNPPSEKQMNMSRLSQAQDFFVLLSGKAKQVAAVHHAIGGLVGDDAEGLGGRLNEKLAILSRAWAILCANPKATVSEHDVALTYWDDEEGVKHLLAGPDGYVNCFGGVDMGEKVKKTSSEDGVTPAPGAEGKAPTPAEMSQEQQKIQGSRAQKAQATIDQTKKVKGNEPPLSDAELLERRQKFANRETITAGKPPLPVKPQAPKLQPKPTNKDPKATTSGKK